MSNSSKEQNPEQTNFLAPGLAFGLILGAAFGIVFGVALDNMAFMAIGVGAGLTLALSIGTAMQERQKEDGA
jgi:predicted outer membrane lipoprotein